MTREGETDGVFAVLSVGRLCRGRAEQEYAADCSSLRCAVASSSGSGPACAASKNGDTVKLRQYQVDAFASRVFEGNPAAVVPLASWLDDPILQAIADENHLAATAFFVPSA